MRDTTLFSSLKSRRAQVMAFTAVAAVAAGAVYMANQSPRRSVPSLVTSAIASAPDVQPSRSQHYTPTAEQWSRMSVEPASSVTFRDAHLTEGKISINEDRATPVFSPYAGRVTRLAAKPGDHVKAGQPLFFIEATDMVQAQNDFLSASSGLSKAKARVTLTEIVEKQNRTLFDSKAGSLREFQTAQAELNQARSEQRAAEAALEAARNRLVILGKTDEEIKTFETQGRISPETPILAPIDGTVIQRKVGPGQYVSYTSTGSLDPVFTIGDMNTVWVLGYVRESEASKVRVGHPLEFSVLSYPGKTFRATIDYVAPSLDVATRRLLVRATVDNAAAGLKPEMFANVTVFGDSADSSVAVPHTAVIFEGERARIWVANEDRTFELRDIRTGIVRDKMIQVLEGVAPGERVVTKGGIFVDKAANS